MPCRKLFASGTSRLTASGSKRLYRQTRRQADIYITDDLLSGSHNKTGPDYREYFSVVYEDDNILLVNKKQGVPSILTGKACKIR